MIDLHVHTSMSDGTLSPVSLVRLAAAKGIRAIAVTDHDTVAGVCPAQAEGELLGVEVIAGVEISTQWVTGILHILGLFIDPYDRLMLNSLDYLRRCRLERIPKILDRLSDCNVLISSNEVNRQAVGGVPGRPHVAEIMVQKGYVKTIQEAFDRYLKKGAPAYVEKVKLPPIEAVKLITRVGGLAVLAHPYSLNENEPECLEKILRDLISYGLQGIETYYPRHTPQQTKAYLDLARKLDLLVSGGTDFHGSNKPEVQLGIIPGRDPIPYSLLDHLKTRKKTLYSDNGSSEDKNILPASEVYSTDRTCRGRAE